MRSKELSPKHHDTINELFNKPSFSVNAKFQWLTHTQPKRQAGGRSVYSNLHCRQQIMINLTQLDATADEFDLVNSVLNEIDGRANVLWLGLEMAWLEHWNWTSIVFGNSNAKALMSEFIGQHTRKILLF